MVATGASNKARKTGRESDDGALPAELTQARRFEDLAADHEAKAMPEIEPIETGLRQLAKLEAAEPEAERPPALTLRAR